MGAIGRLRAGVEGGLEEYPAIGELGVGTQALCLPGTLSRPQRRGLFSRGHGKKGLQFLGGDPDCHPDRVRKGLWVKPGAGMCGQLVLDTSLQAGASGTPAPPCRVLGPHSQLGLLTALPRAPRPPVLSA